MPVKVRTTYNTAEPKASEIQIFFEISRLWQDRAWRRAIGPCGGRLLPADPITGKMKLATTQANAKNCGPPPRSLSPRRTLPAHFGGREKPSLNRASPNLCHTLCVLQSMNSLPTNVNLNHVPRGRNLWLSLSFHDDVEATKQSLQIKLNLNGLLCFLPIIRPAGASQRRGPKDLIRGSLSQSA